MAVAALAPGERLISRAVPSSAIQISILMVIEPQQRKQPPEGGCCNRGWISGLFARNGTVGDIGAEVGVLPADLLQQGVGALLSFGHRVPQCGHTEHPAAGSDNPVLV